MRATELLAAIPRHQTNTETQVHYSAANSLCPLGATMVQDPRTPPPSIVSRWASGQPPANLRSLPTFFTKGRARGTKPRLYPRQPSSSGFFFQLHQVPAKACQEIRESARLLSVPLQLFDFEPSRFRKPLPSQHLEAVSARSYWQAGCTTADRGRLRACASSRHGAR